LESLETLQLIHEIVNYERARTIFFFKSIALKATLLLSAQL